MKLTLRARRSCHVSFRGPIDGQTKTRTQHPAVEGNFAVKNWYPTKISQFFCYVYQPITTNLQILGNKFPISEHKNIPKFESKSGWGFCALLPTASFSKNVDSQDMVLSQIQCFRKSYSRRTYWGIPFNMKLCRGVMGKHQGIGFCNWTHPVANRCWQVGCAGSKLWKWDVPV